MEEGRPIAGVFRVPQGWAPRFQTYDQQLDCSDYLPGLSGAQLAFTYGCEGSLHERHGSLRGSSLWNIPPGGLCCGWLGHSPHFHPVLQSGPSLRTRHQSALPLVVPTGCLHARAGGVSARHSGYLVPIVSSPTQFEFPSKGN